MKNLDWFEDRVGFTVLRGSTEVDITGFDMARKLFEIQDDRYNFSDKLRIHRSPQPECEACSA
jgi:hypothetical protein